LVPQANNVQQMAFLSARHGMTSLRIAALTFVMVMNLTLVKKRVRLKMKILKELITDLPLPENICERFSNLCTQICVPTDNKSHICKCHEGYELLEDNITCVRKKANLEVIDNEIPQALNETTTLE